MPPPAWGRKQLLAAAAGNPLFLEQLVASLGEQRRADGLSLPPTIQALLAARLERLGPGERAVLARAAILGMTSRWQPSPSSCPSRHVLPWDAT